MADVCGIVTLCHQIGCGILHLPGNRSTTWCLSIILHVSTKFRFLEFDVSFGNSRKYSCGAHENWIIEKPIIAKKWFIITTYGGGYCHLRSPSHYSGNALDSDKPFSPIALRDHTSNGVSYKPIKQFYALCGNALIKLQHRILSWTR